MKKQLLIGLLFAASLGILPSMSVASNDTPTNAHTLQHMRGGGAVYMDYATGGDMMLVDRFHADNRINWDVYVSDQPTQERSWEKVRTYRARDFDELNTDYIYNVLSGPAVRFSGDWYFAVSVQSLGESTTLPEEIQIWKITKRGGKPKLAFRIEDTHIEFGAHSPLMLLNDRLVVVDSQGNVYRSVDGRDWNLTNTIAEVTEHGYRHDIVSNGETIFLSLDDRVYRSPNARTWTLIGDLCEEEDVCDIYNIGTRVSRGVFAVVESGSYPDTEYALWVYTRNGWSSIATLHSTLTALTTVGDKTFFLQYKGENGYQHAIKKILPNGQVKTIRGKRRGSPMAILTSSLALLNYRDAAFVTLVHY